jgi:hypothetical protein
MKMKTSHVLLTFLGLVAFGPRVAIFFFDADSATRSTANSLLQVGIVVGGMAALLLWDQRRMNRAIDRGQPGTPPPNPAPAGSEVISLETQQWHPATVDRLTPLEKSAGEVFQTVGDLPVTLSPETRALMAETVALCDSGRLPPKVAQELREILAGLGMRPPDMPRTESGQERGKSQGPRETDPRSLT